MQQMAAAGDRVGEKRKGTAGVWRNLGVVRGLTIALVGALLTAAVTVAALAPGRIGPLAPPSAGTGEPTISQVAPSDIAGAMVTLDPASAQQIAADAKACKVPMAWVILVKQGAGPDGTIRIRSGDYLSPPFRVTSAPQRIAVPYPAPYATGHGVLSVVGEAHGLALFINPVWHIETLNGAASLKVFWTPTNPC